MERVLKKIALLGICLVSISWSQDISLSSGWNLLGSGAGISDINSTFSDADIKTVWSYKEGNWLAYSPDESIRQSLQNASIGILQNMDAGRGFWINADANTSISLSQSVESEANTTVSSGWSLLGSKVASAVYPQCISENQKTQSIWAYNDSAWSAYSPNTTTSQILEKMSLDPLLGIESFDGFWINSIESQTIGFKQCESDLAFGDKQLVVSNGVFSTIQTTSTNNNNFNLKVKLPTSNVTDLKIGMSIYRYANDTTYDLGIGPIAILGNAITTATTLTVAKKGSDSATFETNTDTSLALSLVDGTLALDAGYLASLFDKSLPSSVEDVKVKVYLSNLSPIDEMNVTTQEFKIGIFTNITFPVGSQTVEGIIKLQ